MDMVSNNTDLYFRSKRTSLIILAVTAIICSRILFVLFNDPEGPNLLIVTVFALAVYLSSLAVYIYGPFKINGVKRLSAVICIQILAVISLYFCIR